MPNNPMGFQIPPPNSNVPEEDQQPSRSKLRQIIHCIFAAMKGGISEQKSGSKLQRITAIPAKPTSLIRHSCEEACEAMNSNWTEKVPHIGGKWIWVEEENHFSIFFKGRELRNSEIELMFLLAWQLLPHFFEPGRFDPT